MKGAVDVIGRYTRRMSHPSERVSISGFRKHAKLYARSYEERARLRCEKQSLESDMRSAGVGALVTDD